MPRRQAFTLVELLVVIGIIAVLIGILLPSLSAAQEQARTIKCASNLRNIGNGLAIYLAENKQIFPPAYIYEGQKIVGNTQTPAAAVNGYVHWSSYLYGQTKAGKGVAAEAFTCPSFEQGGLPPTNPEPGNFDPGQAADNAGVVDQQAPRCAFTVNEAIMPRNKWVIGFQGAARPYRYVNAGKIKDSSNVILATEWNHDWRIVADTGRSNDTDTVCKSHRPVHGFVSKGGTLDLSSVGDDPFRPATTSVYTPVSETQLDPDPKAGGSSRTRLDWVGRNHGKQNKQGDWNVKSTNFLYVDGHVETKHIRDTLNPFQWGKAVYSLE
ncbi:type II secretion system protein [Humisphaera borealis]|uniref:Type II secretion system protein n=2 Tax=Humisphaera borealis TaxID=2807512 RepID=A0A7M2X426_9BACT|nr:type II secretion system protein [Humisphaera borealis]